ncbi:MAG TPA: VWA domain-containing protein [Byssovorax sp.]|jgi:Ca-activated chloride channel family protein|nr:VWA domain-containing protein [Polyangia bacterium]
MRFAEPHWLVIGAIVAALFALVLWRGERLRARALELLGEAHLRSGAAVPSRARRTLRVVVATLAIAAGFTALARPQRGLRWETMKRRGTDLLLVVDTSKSMDADDVKPSRLERAKLAIRDLVDRFPGDRIGLVAFAGDAFTQSPMTLDHQALLETVDALDTQTIAKGGTDVGRAIDVAARALTSDGDAQRIMVLLTDGEDLEGRGLAEASRAGAAGITIETVGVGTRGGELVPARDEHGHTVGVVRDAAGAPVRSRLDEPGLEAIALAAHGAYRPLGADGKGLDRLYDDSLAKLTHAETSARTRRVYAELFEVPLAVALALLVLDALLDRRWRAATARPRRATQRLAAATGAALVMTAAAPALASVASAAKAYAAGRFADAAKEFEAESKEHPKDARLAFNAGDAAYRAGDYEAADAAFERSLGAAGPALQQRVLYNRGDALYRLGAAQKPEARAETIARWKAAIEDYDGAIALDPKDQDAVFNRDLVKRRLAALEQQPKPEPKPDDKKSDKGGGADEQREGASGDKADDKGGGADKQRKGASGAKADDKGGGADKQREGASGAEADDQHKGSKPTDSRGRDAATPANPGEGAAPPERGRSGDDASGATGRLSAHDARALLNSLRGDERRGVRRDATGDAPTDDAAGKDW